MYATLTIGSEVQESDFYLNQKGYLGMSDRQKTPNGSQSSSVSHSDVRIGFIEQNIKEMMIILLALGHKAGTLTPAQERAYTGTIVPQAVDFETLTEEDLPF